MTLESEICPYFGTCGGCRNQDLDYDEQLRHKSLSLESLFAPFWSDPIEVRPSPAIFHYRNKVELNFAGRYYPEAPEPGTVRETVLGFKVQGQWYRTLDLDECRLMSPELTQLLAAVRVWHLARDMPYYDNRRNTGVLRKLLVREGKRTGERLVALITADGEVDRAAFTDAVRQSGYPATTIYHGILRRRPDICDADELTLLYGDEYLHEELRIPGLEGTPLRFRISPFSFFQTNTLATEQLYGRIREWVQEAAHDLVYDLYGGMGGIAFTVADVAENVVSVECVESASADGRHNAEVNGITNVRFDSRQVEAFLADGLAPKSTVILDPPRSGLMPKVVNRLVDLAPSTLIYISCKPTSFAKELPLLLSRYRLETLEAVDCFPHTDHVELLARLQLR